MSKRAPQNSTQNESRPRGRPRSSESDAALLEATYNLLAEKGYSRFSIESLVERTGIAKTTIYRRWPTKSALAMGAVLARINPYLDFPVEGSFEEKLLKQMRNLAKVFQSDHGKVISSLIGAAQDDPELADAIRTEYLQPRRVIARRFLTEAQELGEFPKATPQEMEAFIDFVYGGLYFRLLVKHAPMKLNDLEHWIRLALSGLK